MNAATTIWHSRRGGALRTLLFSLLVVAALAVLGWVFFLPTLVKRQVTTMSGFQTDAESVSANPFGASVHLAGFHLSNPSPAFAVPDFVDLELLDLRLRPLSFLGERTDIPRLTIDVEKVTFVTNRDGVTNASLFKANVEKYLGWDQDAGGGAPAEETTRPFIVRDLVVRIGRVVLIDYSKGEKPETRTVELGIDRRFTDVTSVKTVLAPVVADVLASNVGGLAGSVGKMVPGQFGDVLKQAGALLDDPKFQKEAREVKKLFESLTGGGKP